MLRLAPSVLLALLLAAPAPAAEAPVDHRHQYRACVTLAERGAAEALASARAWEAKGGGVYARHCMALALFQRGDYAEAAARFEALADEVRALDAVEPAALFGQAANAWLMAGQLRAARQSIDRALDETPDDAGLLVDKGRILGADGDYEGALAALDKALALVPEDDDALTFRASALRRLDRLDEAFQAADKALKLDPENPSAWLERALVRYAKGDDSGARLDLVTVRSRFNGTPAAQAADAMLSEMTGRGR